jgi:TP53 regulating kinase and related kinases
MDEAPFLPGVRIYQGAEATLTTAVHLHRPAVVKVRAPKGYRIKELEAAIARGRMRNEARLLRRAREAGVGAPALYDGDPEACSLILEYLGGQSLRSTYDSLPPASRRRCAALAGAAIGRLHKASIIHGDLTTSNMIVRDGTLHLFDFSLGHVSGRLEDRAVDLKAFKDSFHATHLAHAAEFAIVLAAYRRALGPGARPVIGHIRTIERRRRYA